MTKYLLLIFLLAKSLSVLGQGSPRVSNVRFQLDEKAKVIEISYDVAGLSEGDSVYVTVTGRKAGAIVPRALTGAIGTGVKSGRNQKITWDVMADNLKIDDELTIKVNVLAVVPMLAKAEVKKPVVPKTRGGINGAALLTLGAGLAAGGGLYYMSTIKKAESAEAYKAYQVRNWNHKSDLKFVGNDTDLQNNYAAQLEKTKEDYNKAKRLQRTSKMMLFGGIALVVADAVFTIPNLRKKSQGKKMSLLMDVDHWGIASAGVLLKF